MQCLIQNLIWFGGDGRPTRAKIVWSNIILPTSQGSQGLVDSVCQSRALLGKLIVRGLLPEENLEDVATSETPQDDSHAGEALKTRGLVIIF